MCYTPFVKGYLVRRFIVFGYPLVVGAGVSFIYHYIHLDLVLVLSGIGEVWGAVIVL